MEKRDAPRHKCFLRAFVHVENSSVAVECVVRELSDTGARLHFSKLPPVSEFVDLHIPIKGQNFRSKVQWREGDEIGVAFHSTTYMNTGEIGLDRRVDRLESEVAMLKKAIKLLQKDADRKLEVA